MRIAIVHNYHRSGVPSGEDVIVDAQIDAFARAGHSVVLISQHNDEHERRRLHQLEAAVAIATGIGPDPTAALLDAQPDVVHVHNLFPYFGSRWLARWQGPLVGTLHNFRPMCVVGTLLRDGQRCTDCITDPGASLRHRCNGGSTIATLPLTIANRGGAPRNPLVARADRLITISERAAGEYVSAGVDRDRITVVPNALLDLEAATDEEPTADGERRWMVVARLSPEKGVDVLLEAWPAGLPIDVVGSGEDETALRARFADRPEIRFLGHRQSSAVRALLRHATGLVVPSLWAEAGPPLTYVEALAAGVPVVAVAGNGAADDIAAHGSGVVVELTEDRALDPEALAIALQEVVRDREQLALVARDRFEQRFGTDRWVRALLDVYRAAGAVDAADSPTTTTSFEGAPA